MQLINRSGGVGGGGYIYEKMSSFKNYAAI